MSPRMGSKRETYDAIHYIVPHVRAPGQRSAVCLTGSPAARRGFLRDLEEGGWTQEIFCRRATSSCLVVSNEHRIRQPTFVVRQALLCSPQVFVIRARLACWRE